jgi:hypothetical protein
MGLVKVSTPLLLAVSLLSSLAQAAPAPRFIKARDYVTDIVTETVWTTVDVTTTVYVDDLPSTSAPATTAAVVASSAEEVESTPAPIPAPAASTTPAPEPAVPVPSASEETVAAPSSPAGEFAESSAPPSSPSAPAPAPEYTPAPEPASSPAPAPKNEEASGSSGGSESATCENGATCKGDITWYEGGLGACGQTVDTEGDMAIALPYGLMGPLSNSNPYCGRSVTVKNPVSGTTVQGIVKDKCMGCVGRAIDLTSKMFKAVTDGNGDGRVHDVQWWFT